MAADPVWKRRVLDAPRVERVAELTERGFTLKILGTVRAADQWVAASDFRKRLLEGLQAAGIEIAGVPPVDREVGQPTDPPGPIA